MEMVHICHYVFTIMEKPKKDTLDINFLIALQKSCISTIKIVKNVYMSCTLYFVHYAAGFKS